MDQQQAVLAVYRLGGSGFIVQHAGVPYAKESAESAADLVRQLLIVGQSSPASMPMTPVMPVMRPASVPQVAGPVSDTETDKQRRNLARLVQGRISGAMDDREFSEKCREWCPLIELAVCLDALDRGFMNEPMVWEGGAEAPHAPDDGDMLMDDLSVEPSRQRSGIGDPMAGMIDFGSGNIQSMVQDYVVDDLTGAVLPDGR